MKFSVSSQEKSDPFNTGECLIEVTAWAVFVGIVCFIDS